MKKFIKLFVVLNLFLSSFLVFSQDNPRELQDIVGAKGSDSEYQMGNRGYALRNVSKSETDVYQNWYNSAKDKCVTIWLSNNRVQTIINSPNDCGNNNFNNNNNNDRNNSNLNDLVGARGGDSEYQLGQRGYTLSRTDKADYVIYQNWYNSSLRKCVKVALVDGKVRSIVDSPNDCGNNNNNNYNNSGNVDNLVGQGAKYAYQQMSKKGYYEIKTVKDGGNTYKLWKKNDKCKKTTSRGGKITSIINSDNCN